MSDLLNEFSKNRLLAELLIANNNVYSVELNRSLSEVFRELVNEHLSAEDAKYYQCKTCYQWLDNWGKLVIIDTSRPLMIRSVLWSTEIADEKSVWQRIFAKMGEYVENAVIDIRGNYSRIPVSPQFTPTATKGTFAHMWIDPWKVKVPRLEGSLVTALEKRIMSTRATTLLTVKSAFSGGKIAKLRNTDAILSGIEAAMKLPIGSKDTRVITNATVALLDKHPAMRDYPNSVHNKLFDQVVHDPAGAFSEWKFITSTSNYRRSISSATEEDFAEFVSFVKENDYSKSIEQTLATIDEMPKVWESKPLPEVNEGKDILKMLESKAGKSESNCKISIYGMAELVDIILPAAAEISVLVGAFSPTFINRMKYPCSKQIFTWDTSEQRRPFLPWSFDQYQHRLYGDKGIKCEAIVRSSDLFDIRASGESLIFMTTIEKDNIALRTQLFAEVMPGEFQRYTRVLEYVNKTAPEFETGELVPAGITLYCGNVPGGVKNDLELSMDVKLNEEGKKAFKVDNLLVTFAQSKGSSFDVSHLPTIAPTVDIYKTTEE